MPFPTLVGFHYGSRQHLPTPYQGRRMSYSGWVHSRATLWMQQAKITAFLYLEVSRLQDGSSFNSDLNNSLENQTRASDLDRAATHGASSTATLWIHSSLGYWSSLNCYFRTLKWHLLSLSIRRPSGYYAWFHHICKSWKHLGRCKRLIC